MRGSFEKGKVGFAVEFRVAEGMHASRFSPKVTMHEPRSRITFAENPPVPPIFQLHAVVVALSRGPAPPARLKPLRPPPSANRMLVPAAPAAGRRPIGHG